MKALSALVRKDLVLYFSNKRALAITLAAPVLMAAFFGSVMGGAPKKARAAIVIPVGFGDAAPKAMFAPHVHDGAGRGDRQGEREVQRLLALLRRHGGPVRPLHGDRDRGRPPPHAPHGPLEAAAGGARVPAFVFPEWLQTVTLFIPTRWAVDGLEAMTWRGLGLEAAAAPVASMLAFSALFALIAIKRFDWEE